MLGALVPLVSPAGRHQPRVRPAPATPSNAGTHRVPGGFPTTEGDFTKLQVEAAQEIGGIRARMLLDAPEEIEKYHWGPLQIALCLLAGVLVKYEALCTDDQSFQDDGIDAYRRQHHGFVNGLRELRDALLHQRYENMPTQAEFVKKFAGGQRSGIVELLLEGRAVYEGYVRRMGRSLKDRRNA